MSDLVERLLARADDSDNQELDREAAAEIERLRTALTEISKRGRDSMATIIALSALESKP